MKVRLLQGQALDRLRQLPSESVHCVVTSPPYWGLRDYGVAGAYGMESTIEEYVGKMVAVFWEVRRVLRQNGVLFLNLGDSYASGGNGGGGKHVVPLGEINKWHQAPGLKPKDLCGIPWRVALALQADGWWLRSDIIWAKPNPMPESCTDRPTKAHEYIFLLTKSAHYFWDQEAVKEECQSGPSDIKKMQESKERIGGFYKDATDPMMKASSLTNIGQKRSVGSPNGRNLRTVWEIATHPCALAHFATFPPELVRRCVAAGTSEQGCCPKCRSPWKRVVEKKGGTTGKSWHNHEDDLGRGMRGGDDGHNAAADLYKTYSVTTTGWAPTCTCNAGESTPCTVLDPFSGAGTTALVAAKMERNAIGIELNPDYVEMSRKRIAGELGMLCEIAVDTPGEIAV